MEQSGTVKMPYLLKAVIFSYLGWYGVLFFNGWIDENHIFASVFKLFMISLCTAFFSYGVICFIQDVKNGGIRFVLDRIRKFLNG